MISWVAGHEQLRLTHTRTILPTSNTIGNPHCILGDKVGVFSYLSGQCGIFTDRGTGPSAEEVPT